MKRRGFLKAMLGAAAAPAIVRAESLMKIVVPKREIILPHDPFHFGNMVWKPELLLVLPTTRNKTGEIQVHPAYTDFKDIRSKLISPYANYDF